MLLAISQNLTNKQSLFSLQNCFDDLVLGYGLDLNTTLMIAKIDWYPSIISNYTNQYTNTSGISVFFFSVDPNLFIDAKNCANNYPLLLNIPAIYNTTQYNISNTIPLVLTQGLNVNLNNPYDDFFNSRCFGISISDNGINYDLTIGMRRELYFRRNQYKCFDIFNNTQAQCNFSYAFTSNNIDYVQCQCSGSADVAYKPIEVNFDIDLDIYDVNLDVFICPQIGFNVSKCINKR
jgi:hypothetical protein